MPAELNAVTDAIGDIVGPEPMARPDFERELEARVGGWAVKSNQGWMGNYRNWPMALGWAAALGLVCYGPGEGGRITFVRLADWSGWREVDPFDPTRVLTLVRPRPGDHAAIVRWAAGRARRGRG